MRRAAFLFIVVISALLFWSGESFAHHKAGSADSQRPDTQFFLSSDDNKSGSQVYSGFRLDHLDHNVGRIYTAFLGGEYALGKRLSVQAEVPFIRLNHNFRADETGIGDVSVGGKFALLAAETSWLALHTLWTLPTGDETLGLGRGAVGQQAGISFIKDLAALSVLADFSGSWGYEDSAEPVFSTTLGVTSPRFFDEHIVAGIFLTNETFIFSDVFTNGSGKFYLGPQLYVYPGDKDRWMWSLGAEISVYDYLDRKSGVALTNTSFALFADTLVSVTTGLYFNF